MTTGEGVHLKLLMHASMARGGYLYVREVVEYPGIVVTTTRETREKPVVQVVTFRDTDFPTLRAAIDAWRADPPKPTIDTSEAPP